MGVFPWSWMDYKEPEPPQDHVPDEGGPPIREPSLIQWWDSTGLYDRLRQARAGRDVWILHDGPPYANGHIHMGHALNKVLKDIVVKSQDDAGFDAPYVPGLGLPRPADRASGRQGAGRGKKHGCRKVEMRRRCRAYAAKFIDIQREEFQRLGVFGDWEQPVPDHELDYEATIVRELGRVRRTRGRLQGAEAGPLVLHCETALAEAEVEYEDHAIAVDLRQVSRWRTISPAELPALAGNRSPSSSGRRRLDAPGQPGHRGAPESSTWPLEIGDEVLHRGRRACSKPFGRTAGVGRETGASLDAPGDSWRG